MKTAIYLPFFYFFWINQTDISRYFCSPGCCYSMLMKDAHRCVERAMHHNCPVCFEVNKALIQCNTYVSKILKSFLILREVFFFFFPYSFYLTLWEISLCCLVDTQYIWNAWKRWNNITGKHYASCSNSCLLAAFSLYFYFAPSSLINFRFKIVLTSFLFSRNISHPWNSSLQHLCYMTKNLSLVLQHFCFMFPSISHLENVS